MADIKPMSPQQARQMLQVLANPLRENIWLYIYQRGYARATDIAQHLGKPVNSMSYHLRMLHKAGLIKEDPSRAVDGRDRVWVHDESMEAMEGQWSTLLGDEGFRASLEALVNYRFAAFAEILRWYMGNVGGSNQPKEDRDAASEQDVSKGTAQQNSSGLPDDGKWRISSLATRKFWLTEEQTKEILREVSNIISRYDKLSGENLEKGVAVCDGLNLILGLASDPGVEDAPILDDTENIDFSNVVTE